MKEYQVTLFNPEGKYKPVSCIIKTDSTDKEEIKKKGITKICQKRFWTKADLVKYGYTKVKYGDPQAIREERAAAYEKLKEEKYASGEWKKPNQ